MTRDSDVTPAGARRWAYVGVLTIAGFVLIWSAGEQLVDLRASVGADFQFPRDRLLFYLLTLIAAGIVFGLAALSRAGTIPVVKTALAGWSTLPLLLIILFYWTFAWPPGLSWIRGEVLFFLTSEVTVVASCLVFGFFLSTLAAPRRGRVSN